MIKLSVDMPYQSPVLFTSFWYNNEKYNVFFHRGYGDRVNKEIVPNLSHYFIQIYKDINEGEVPKICAYIYFYLDFGKKETKYIGTFVDAEYRNVGFASLLTSLWTWICMDNNFYEYVTSKKQRKPFLLYLLKLYGFEINDINQYEASPHTIYICRNAISLDKCLYFKDSGQAKSFQGSNVALKDNYQVISEDVFRNGEVEVLDKIILSTPYYLQDFDKAYMRCRVNLEKRGIL